ncbi:MAG: hypothetical protein CVV50_03255, partial [Spirochaetae bacterium HGW-Spirochaetae-6]
MSIKILILILFIFPGWAFSDSALSHFESLGLPQEWQKGVSALEKEMLQSLYWKNGKIGYGGSLLSMYLILSGANSKEELERYEELLKNFLVEFKASGEYQSVLESPYHTAELLLVRLHEKIFKRSLEGRDAGDNIGVLEALDNGNFNCYMSALLYNGFLEALGVKGSAFHAVPEHVYSVLKLRDQWVAVETTNRHGFDPELVLKPDYLPRLTPSTVRLLLRQYRNPVLLDNYSIILDLLNNRSLVYSGKFAHSRLKVKPDSNRALFYAFLADYLSGSQKEEFALLSLNRLLDKLEKSLNEDIKNLPQLAHNWVKLLSRERYAPYQRKMFTSWNVWVSNASNDFIRRALGRSQTQKKEQFASEFLAFSQMASGSMLQDEELKNRVLRNLMVYLDQLLEK